MGHVERRGPAKFRARYRGPDGRERSRTFTRKIDAERFLAKTETDKLRGTWLDPANGKVTYEEWAEQYFASSVHKRPTTLARDRRVNEKHLVPRIGHRSLASLTPSDIRRMVEEMNQTLAPATVRTDYGVLRAVLRAAVDADLIAQSPCRGIKLPATKPKRIQFLTVEEIHRLAAVTPAPYGPSIYLAGVLGLRWSEVAGLRVGRIDFLRRTLEISETCAEVDGKIMFADVKTRSSRRTLAMPEFLVHLLAEHLAARGRPGPDELVFTMPEGGPLRRTTFRSRVWDPAVRKAGLDGLTFHHLRDTAVGLMIDVGAHPKAIQDRLEHSSVRTTMDVYGHVLPTTDDAITQALDVAFSESRGLSAACDETGTDP